MRLATRFLPIGFLLVLTLLLTACGSSTSTTTSSYGSGSAATTDTSTTPTSPPTTGKYYATPTTSTGNTGAATIKTASATVNGKAVTILTDARGMTLYYFTPDTKTKAACTGGCASAWPPLLVTEASKLGSATKLPGMLTAMTSVNGSQVQYQGHFLYTYASDSAPGQTNGEGVGGKWFVATTNIA